MRLPRALCAVVSDCLSGSHASLDRLFLSSGAIGEPPALAHDSKWKEWLYQIGQDTNVDSLRVLGNILEEFMDLPPPQGTPEYQRWQEQRARVEVALQDSGLRYYRFGRVLPQGEAVSAESEPQRHRPSAKPAKVEELLEVLVKGLRRAMHPLTHRRKGAQALSFGNEYDVQDLLHVLLRPWVSDIRAEEFTPSYAGTSTRMDFLLPAYSLVIETKIIRDRAHARRVGDELIIDIEHYRRHPDCDALWCVVYDPDHLIANAEGLKSDLQGKRRTPDGEVDVKVFVL
jgi:hypothetical protein